MKTWASELYTLTKLPAVIVVTALSVLMAGVGASLQWSLPYLLQIDPPQAGEGPAGEQVAALIASSDPALPEFQLAALDITGSGQSSGISTFLIAIVALAITAASVSFSSGAVVWKVVAMSRLRWALAMAAAVLTAVLAVGVLSCLLNLGIALVASAIHGVTLHLSGHVLVVWGRGIVAIALLALAIVGVLLGVRKTGIAIGIIVAVVVLGIIFGTVGSLAGWDPAVYSWLPTSAVAAAGGQGLGKALSPSTALLILACWALASMSAGLRSFSQANL